MFRVSHYILISMFIAVMFVVGAQPAHAQTAHATIHVDITNGSLNPPNFGQNGWESDAYRFLQDALDGAHDLLDDPAIDSVELWVAEGTYRPDQRAANSACGEGPPGPNCCPPYGDCQVGQFFINGNITIRGGFAGSEATIDERPDDILQHRTILDGDLKENDEVTIFDPQTGEFILEFDFLTYNDNSQTVLRVTGSGDAVIDRVTVRGTTLIDSARPVIQECVLAPVEGPALRSSGRCRIVLLRCKFALPAAGEDCAIILEDEAEMFLIDTHDPRGDLPGRMQVAPGAKMHVYETNQSAAHLTSAPRDGGATAPIGRGRP